MFATPHAPSRQAPGDEDPDELLEKIAVSLVKKVQEGDRSAFGELYQLYHGNVFRFVYKRVSSRELAEDLAGETFLKALRAIGTFTSRPDARFGAWLITIARNLVADHYKSPRYRHETTIDISNTDHTLFTAAFGMNQGRSVLPSPENEVLDSVDNSMLQEAITYLNPLQKQCIRLRYLQQMSLAEVADAMHSTSGNIKMLQHRAEGNLRRRLIEHRAELLTRA